MNKYTPGQLKGMAQEALDSRATGGVDYLFVVMTLCGRTGLAEREVERRIEQLAATGECE